MIINIMLMLVMLMLAMLVMVMMMMMKTYLWERIQRGDPLMIIRIIVDS